METIVIAGGGVAGLELATRLGRQLGARRKKRIILVDSAPTHFWKPLLHSVAAGTIDPANFMIDYAKQAADNGFEFICAELTGIDRGARELTLLSRHAAHCDRVVRYDRLVLSFGSVTNFFGVPGAAQHCLSLDSVRQAEAFRRRFLQRCAAARPPVDIAIVGAGPTGIELAADLRRTVDLLVRHRLNALESAQQVRVRVLERGDRLLPSLDAASSRLVARQLRELGIEVHTGTAVAEVGEDHVKTADGRVFPAAITVWSAGVQGPGINERLGLALNRNRQVLVNGQLRTPGDHHVYAMGDCCSLPAPDGGAQGIPPSAQAARQQAIYLARLLASSDPAAMPDFRYRDYGTLVSLGRHGAIGVLREVAGQRQLRVQGTLALAMYLLAYQRYVFANLGPVRTLGQMLVRWVRSKLLMPVRWH